MPYQTKPIKVDDLSKETFHRLQESNLYRNWHYKSWQELIRWSIINNPYRHNRPAGYGLYHTNKLVAAVFFVYLPTLINHHSDTSASYCDIFSDQSLPVQETLKFAHYYMSNKVTPSIICCHASHAVSNMMRQFGAKNIYNSDKTFTKTISIKNKLSNYMSKFIPLVKNENALKQTIYKIDKFDFEVMKKPSFFALSSEDKIKLNTLYKDKKNLNVQIIKNADYLIWRYMNNPFNENYIFVKMYYKKQLKGIAILQNSALNMRICEIIIPDINHLKPMVSLIESYAKKTKCISVSTKVILNEYEYFWIKSNYNVILKKYCQFLADSTILIQEKSDLNGSFSFGDFKLC